MTNNKKEISTLIARAKEMNFSDPITLEFFTGKFPAVCGDLGCYTKIVNGNLSVGIYRSKIGGKCRKRLCSNPDCLRKYFQTKIPGF